MRILLVEDDPVISKNIQLFLNKRGFSIDHTQTINNANQKLSDEEYDCLILDRGLPDGDGIKLIKTLREDKIDLPILILTAKNQDNDIVEGLNYGADDYLSKPFDMNVLAARLKALIRRKDKIPQNPILKISNLVLDTNTAYVTRANKAISLSPREYALLEYLMVHKNFILDRLTLMSHVWDETLDIFSNTVDVHIKYLRSKIDQGFKKKLIKTVRGRGYMISDK